LIQGSILKELKNFQEYILFELHEGIEFFFILEMMKQCFSKSGTGKIFIDKINKLTNWRILRILFYDKNLIKNVIKISEEVIEMILEEKEVQENKLIAAF